MGINELTEKWNRQERRVECLTLRASERTITELQAIASKHRISCSAVAHDFLLLGLSMYEKEQGL